ncbi:MAG: hypothetical protein DRO06_02375, partial [Thermoproteota archaeon]
SLKRDVGLFGSFAMGYADVGADVFISLGLVAAYAAGASPLAFALAAVAYVTTGLVYAELSSTYPHAGGAQVFAARGLNDPLSFAAGWMLLLTYTVNIALFAMASAGYLSRLVPAVSSQVSAGPLELSGIQLTALLMTLGLTAVNVKGIRESSALNEAAVMLGLAVQTILLALGLTSLDPSRLASQLAEFGSPEAGMASYLPWGEVRVQNFLYGTTLAMCSFIGIESIAQAAEEIKKPHRWIPRATVFSVLAVLVYTIGLCLVGLGTVGWRGLAERLESPLSAVAERLPGGTLLTPVVSLAGFAVNLVSANTGVVGVSRVVYSMGKFGLMPRWFSAVHPRFRTPVRTVVVFGLIGALMTLLGGIEEAADVYAFGALLSYVLVNASAILIRRRDRRAYRPWKTPLNLSLGDWELPLVAVAGLASCSAMWALILLLHPVGRGMGTLWLAVGALVYAGYRRAVGLPILGRVSGEGVRPAAYLMDACALYLGDVPPREFGRAVSDALDPRFRVRLVAPLPRGAGAAEEAEVLREALEEAASLVRGARVVEVRVEPGDPEEVAVREAELADLILLVTADRGLARRISSALPGRVSVVGRW